MQGLNNLITAAPAVRWTDGFGVTGTTEKGKAMGEAKRRGTRDERVAEAVAKREARDRAWNEAQAEHRRQRQEELERLEAAAPKVAPSERKRRVLGSYGRGGIGLVMAAALAASMSVERRQVDWCDIRRLAQKVCRRDFIWEGRGKVGRSGGGKNEMELIFDARSTNGRWGLAIVGPEGTRFPAQGSLISLGTVAGIETYRFAPGDTGTWVLAGGDLQPHGGATLVASRDLQSSQIATILLLGPEAVVEQHGYKRRSSRFVAYVAGEARDIPASILLAMGLIAPESAPAAPIEPPPALTGAMANAFAKLRRAA